MRAMIEERPSPPAILARLDATALFSLGLLLASFALLALVLTLTGLRVDWTGLGLCIVFSIATVALGLALKLCGSRSRIASFALVLGALIGSTVCNTMSVNAGMRLHFPMIDDYLYAADQVLGFDSGRLLHVFAAHPALTGLLQLAYENANWIVVMAIIAASLRRERAWYPLVMYSGSLLLIAILCILMPAEGNVAYSGLAYLQHQGLPSGSGTYYLDTLRYYYDGHGEVVSNAHLSGVAVFPSFHMVMGLTIATSLRGTRLHGLAAAFGILVMISAIPIGGHYVVDLIAGSVVWVIMTYLAGLFEHPAPADPDWQFGEFAQSGLAAA